MHDRRTAKIGAQVIQGKLSTYPRVIHRNVESIHIPISGLSAARSDIIGPDLWADVAVLSACQTVLGKVVAGEGVVSLSHVFLRAGANATLVS